MTTHESAAVELRLPADSAYVSVLRTTTAGLAARLDFTVDDIEDLRIAVGEASALLLPLAGEDSDLDARYDLGRDTLVVHLTLTRPRSHDVDQGSFAWQVLTTLASECALRTDGGVLGIDLTVRSSIGS